MSNNLSEQKPYGAGEDESDDDLCGVDDDRLRDDEQVKDLFSERVFATVPEMLQYMKETYNFDLRGIISCLGCDMYGSIKIINFLRSQYRDQQQLVSGGIMSIEATRELACSMATLLKSNGSLGSSDEAASTWQSDVYLKPVLSDDPLLYAFDDDSDDDDDDDDNAQGAAYVSGQVASGTQETNIHRGPISPANATQVSCVKSSSAQNAVVAVQALAHEHDTLQQRVAELESQLEAAKKQVQGLILTDEDVNMKPTSSFGHVTPRTRDARNGAPDAYYFDSYGHLDIHKEMLSDVARTEAYRDAIVRNPKVFKDKVVIDVGCGTSILSLFAATTGAKHVFGIELSNMAHGARKVIAANGFADRITVLQQRAETVTTLIPENEEASIGKADVIVSEWMGYALLFESMLDSVLDVRNRLLKPGGRVFPNTADIFVEGMTSSRSSTSFWKNVYGYDMSCLADAQLTPELTIPDVTIVPQDCICTDRATLHSIDMETVEAHELDFTRPFTLHVTDACTMTALVLSFDTSFTASEASKDDWEQDVILSTRVNATPTHWQQTVMHLKTPLVATAGMVVFGQLTYRRNARNPRNIDLDLVAKSGDGSWAIEQAYTME